MKRIRRIVISIIIVLVVALSGAVIFFGRVIPRTTPTHGIISPTSGKVISVFDTDDSTIVFKKQGITNQVTLPEFSGPVHVVLVELNLTDVHVQRAPLTGTVVRTDHFDGDHINALGAEKMTIAATNEKVVSVFKNSETTVGVVQVAGRAARRIRNSITTGDSVAVGKVYGRILLGSQVVIIVPQNETLLVHPGDRVVDGETIIAQ